MALSSSTLEPLEGEAVLFSSQAVDPGGDPLTYSWDFGDGSPRAHGAQVIHTYADDGSYTVTVTVQDDADASTQASRQVLVSNLPPVPEQVPHQSIAAGEELHVQLLASDVAGEKDPLSWSLAEGPGSLSPEGLYTWTPPRNAHGDFLVRAQVTDDEGGTSEVLFSITVSRDFSIVSPGGCGCTGTGEAASSTALLLLAFASLSRRRASRR